MPGIGVGISRYLLMRPGGSSASCPLITNLTTFSLTPTTVTIQWTANGQANFDIYYGATPLAAPNDSTPPTTTSVTNSKTVTGLTASTQYAFYVRSHCAASNSAWTGPLTVTTGAAEFRMTIDTTKPGVTTNTQFRLQLRGGVTYNAVIDWGDSSTTNQTTTTSPTHTYAIAGVYQIKITGTFPSVNYANGTNDRRKITSLDDWGIIAWGANQSSAFNGCSNMVANYTDIPDFSAVTNTNLMFANCTVFDGIMAGINTGNVVQANSMFLNCAAFNHSLDSWNVAKNTDFTSFLQGCTSYNQSMNSWDLSANLVRTWTSFLSGCTSFNSRIDAWNTISLVQLPSFLQGCTSFNQPLWGASFQPSNLTSFLSGCSSFNQPINQWDTSNLGTLTSALQNCTAFNQTIHSWNVSSLLDATDFMTGKTAADYNASYLDAIYNHWSLLSVQPNVIDFGTIKYTLAGAAGKATLQLNGWTISDGGI